MFVKGSDNYMMFEDERSVLNFINDIEARYPVETWKIEEIYVWPIVRLRIGYYLLNHFFNHIKSSNGICHVANAMIKNMKIIGKAFLSDRAHSKQPQKADIIMLGSNSDRSIFLKKGTWFNKNLDAFYVLLRKRGLKIHNEEKFNGEKLNFPRETNSHVFNFTMIIARLRSKIISLVRKPCDIKLQKFNEFLKYCKEFDLPTDGFDKKRLFNDVMYIKDMANYFDKIIKQKKIKGAIFSNWCAEEAMALSLACDINDICSVEIDHGFTGVYCFTCCGWHKFPEKGYALMPKIFWSWAEEMSAAIKTKENYFCNTITGGSTSQAYWLVMGKEIIRDYDSVINHHVPKDRVVILFSLSPCSKSSYPSWIFEYIKNSDKRYFWMLRRHPLWQDKLDFYSELKTENVEIDMSSSIPLMLLLQYTTVHVTLNSGTLFEALECGIPTIFLSRQFFPRVEYLCQSGFVKYAGDENTFDEALRYYVKEGKFCRRNSITDKALDKMLYHMGIDVK